MRLTIVAPHFPPSSLPPAQRVRLMMPHLKKMGVEATVFTTPAKYREESKDPWMLELVGNDFDLIEVKSLNYSWTRKFGIGDLGLRMLPFLFFKLLRHCKENKVDFILYPVPPWYILLIAPLIKWITGVAYGIDFIDPWVSGDTNKLKNASLKRRLSQWIARKLEGMVCRNASIIYAVSEGINQELVKRHPGLNKKGMYAVPYGAEEKDYNSFESNASGSEEVLIRYIGAVWEDAYPVLDALLQSFSLIKINYKLEFIGTSYAGAGLAKQQLTNKIADYQLSNKVSEDPERKSYKEALRLQMESDFLLLFGGMESYYAASKLFGLIASKRPFLAFLNRDSFPAKFLKEANYPFFVEYSNETEELPKNKIDELKKTFDLLMIFTRKNETFVFSDKLIQKHTAFGMTKSFIDPIVDLVK